MNPREYHLAITRCGWTAYPAEAATVDTKCLADIPDAEVLAAIVRFRQEAEHGFPPSPGELRKLCGRSKRVEAQTAWAELRALHKRSPRYGARPQAIEDAWAAMYGDPRTRAGIEALARFGGVGGILAADLLRARSAFCAAFEDETRKLELAAGLGPKEIAGGAR